MSETKIKAPTMCVRLAIEIGTELQLEIVNVSARFKSELIGMETNQYLITKMPDIVDDEFEEKCIKYKGAEVIGRYMYRGTIIGFKTNLVDIISTPARLIFIRYPTKVEEYNVRKNERINCMLPGKLKIDSTVVDGTVVDLSLSGTLISIDGKTCDIKKILTLLSKTDKCEFLIQLPSDPKALLFPVIRRDVRKNDARLNVGLQFINIGTEISYRIGQFISTAKSLHS